MTKTTRARYTLEFKQEAVRLVESGQTVDRTLGLVEQTLFNWVKASRQGRLKDADSKPVRTRAASASATRANACARARAAADEERDRRWYTITFDRLRQLDDMVARACK